MACQVANGSNSSNRHRHNSSSTDIVIGATSAVPVASHFTFRDMGLLNWLCVVSARHPLAAVEGLLSDDQLRPFASLCMTDTSRNLPKRDPPGGQPPG